MSTSVDVQYGGRPCGALCFLRACVIAQLALSAGYGGAALAQERAGRLRPPPTLHCERNQLTSYTGVLKAYHREAGVLRLSIHTDEDTDEAVDVPHPGADPANAFLANGGPFNDPDWARLESSPGVAREGLRLTAWVCLDGRTPPVIDWHFPE